MLIYLKDTELLGSTGRFDMDFLHHKKTISGVPVHIDPNKPRGWPYEIVEKKEYEPPTLRRMSVEEVREKLESLDLDPLVARSIKPPSVAHLLSVEERKQEHLWTKVHGGGPDAILAARTLLAQTWSSSTREQPTTKTIYINDRKNLKWVICTKDQQWWLTKAGAARHAANEAVRFDSEIQAEEAKSAYMRASPDGPKFLVRPVEI